MGTAWVSGASGTLGGAIAARLGRAGHRVVLLGRRREALEETAARVAAAGGTPEVRVVDLTAPDALRGAPTDADIVVHDAAAYAPYARVERVAEEDWSSVWAVGVDAGRRLAAHHLAGMRARRRGRLVFVSSSVASHGGHGQGPYATAKAALVGLARTLALEGGPEGVTSNVVEVGLLDHPRTATLLSGERRAALLARIPLEREGTPDEVAAVVAFLCSDDAAYVTGAVVPVSGGLGLRLT